MEKSDPTASPATRYELLTKIAAGGMATVYVGRVRGAAGFWRLVAIKRAHPHLIEQREFREMLVAEALLASRIHHTNVVSVLDVEEREGELLLVMDYVDGSSLSHLAQKAKEQNQPIPVAVAVRIVLDASAGLQAAHELCDVDGTPLRVVHRDVSPHNVLIGTDGVARIADFGIAKVLHQGLGSTASGVLKGKLSYMAPEYVQDHTLDARSDVYGMGVVLWELLAGRPLFRGKNEVETLSNITKLVPERVSALRKGLGESFDRVVARALARDRSERFPSAGAFAAELERVAKERSLVASHSEVAAFLKHCLGEELTRRKNAVFAGTTPSDPASATASLVVPEAETETVSLEDARSNSVVSLATADVLPLEPTDALTGTAPVPLLRPADAGVDATQPSFAHSRPEGTATSTGRRTGLVYALIAGASLALGVLVWFFTRSTRPAEHGLDPTGSPAASSETHVQAPPSVDEAPPNLAPTPSANRSPPSEPSGSASAAPKSVAPSPKPATRERSERATPSAGKVEKPPPPIDSAPAKPPAEWSPGPNPYPQ